MKIINYINTSKEYDSWGECWSLSIMPTVGISKSWSLARIRSMNFAGAWYKRLSGSYSWSRYVYFFSFRYASLKQSI